MQSTRQKAVPRLDGCQPTLHDFSRKITRPVREKVTNAYAVWVAGDRGELCRGIPRRLKQMGDKWQIDHFRH